MAILTKEEALRQYGLSEKEIKVYLANLKLGSCTVHEISKNANIHRTTTYDILKSLIEKGLASSVIKKKSKCFEVADPSKLISILDEKKQKINQVITELTSIKNTVTAKPSVEFYEGKEGIKTVMEDILKHKKELLVYSSTKDLFNTLKFYFPNFIKERIKNKIHAKVLTEKTTDTKQLKSKDKEELRETRFLPEKVNIPTATYIYENQTIIISLKNEPLAIRIENEQITTTQRTTFNLLWKMAKTK